ncbi:MAG: DUF488 domain-containing protein [Leptolyngbyaceae bacterium]|nr:DUF488 domain-containing protein [Leptolyngbyaceae bacterium]
MGSRTTIRLFTIGFTRKSAAEFFEKLQAVGVRRMIDTRLNNTSQLSGFAKQADLKYFLHKISNIDYEHNLSLAPTPDILGAYKKKQMMWDDYSRQYLNLIEQRQIESMITADHLQNACFLCSENQPHFCHRRLAAEYLQTHFNNLEIIHL